MLDFTGTILTAALIVFVLTALLVFMDLSRAAKLWLAGVLGLWVGLAAASAASGWLSISRPVPVIGIFVATPLVAAALFASSAAGRAAMMSLPLPLMIGLNLGRVFAFLFLLLAAQGRLSGPFPHSAAWGDIITGVLAVPVLWLAQARERHTLAIAAWNVFGMVDLVAAIALGVMSGDGSPLQVFAAPGSGAMQMLPWSFVPTVLVPLWMILHAIIWAQLRRASPSLRGRD